MFVLSFVVDYILRDVSRLKISGHILINKRVCSLTSALEESSVVSVELHTKKYLNYHNNGVSGVVAIKI